ncbi:hypothetical protein A2U01_0001057 [Trifolium medium]|uniref:Uncharacterized protein n=1 Tax=Trifolium medium TaxID=97028 RepID=A0A392LZ65_9FABA|nr:hypothetical protein [Trifolium medium]
MEDDLLIFPSNITAESEAIKAEFADAVDSYAKIIQKKIEGRGMKCVKQIMEYAEKANVKILTLTPYFDPIERMWLDVFEKELTTAFREERERLLKEKQRIEEKKKKLEEEKKKAEREAEQKEAEAMIVEYSSLEASSQNKGKLSTDSGLPAYILKMQEDIEAQRIRKENMAETQKNISARQENMDSKLDAILAFLTPKT